MNKKSENQIITLGCRLNDAESEVILRNLKELNRENDVIVINTCAVTENAKKESIEKILNIIKNNHLKKEVYITGCAAQLDAEKFLKIDGVSRVIGNMDKLSKSSYLESKETKIIWSKMHGEKEKFNQIELYNKNKDEFYEKRKLNLEIEEKAKKSKFSVPLIQNFDEKTRALVQIQNGCNHDCTFCIIHIARGKNRSILPSEIISQIKILLENGYKEIVLTGVDITDYGLDLLDLKTNLARLIKKILNVFDGKLNRLRLSSIDVSEISDELFEIFASDNRIIPYFHLSLQSGSDIILKRMKRRHTNKDIKDFCYHILQKRSDVVFGADIIAGFPTETDENFLETYSLIEEIKNFIHLHVFSFSSHSQTPSSRMPQVKNDIIKKRSKILRDLGMKNRLEFYKNILLNENKIHEVLFENNKIGYTKQFLKFKYEDSIIDIKKGEIKNVKIKDIIIDNKNISQPYYFIGDIV